ncbi:MAG: hypothetical protein QNJ90_07275 [Planctomycetota bacterium]|nr:hypothetical protein [Planctomycetota bacterium]
MRATCLLLLLGLAACGGETATQEPEDSRPCRVQPVDMRGVPLPLKEITWAQEIWISYLSDEHIGQGFRYPRSRDEALAKARDLCRRVHAGADIGTLARRWSNGDFGLADGLCVAPEPSHRTKPDERDVTLSRTAVGDLTPLIEWRGGFWFARRITEREGRRLDAKLRKALKLRARARVIHIHHAGAAPRRHEFDRFPKEKAVAKAWAIIRELEREGGPSFPEMSRQHNNDAGARERDGLLTTIDPISKQKTEWIRWNDRNFSRQLLEVILETGTPGRVHPEPVISGQGVDVVYVLERRSD